MTQQGETESCFPHHMPRSRAGSSREASAAGQPGAGTILLHSYLHQPQCAQRNEERERAQSRGVKKRWTPVPSTALHPFSAFYIPWRHWSELAVIWSLERGRNISFFCLPLDHLLEYPNRILRDNLKENPFSNFDPVSNELHKISKGHCQHKKLWGPTMKCC